MAEQLEGVIARAKKGDYGWGIQLEGREGWLNQTKKCEWPSPPPGAGDRCKLELWTSDAGKVYVSAISVQKNPDTGKSGSEERSNGIDWNVCMYAAMNCLIGNLQWTLDEAGQRTPITPDALLTFAQALYDARHEPQGEAPPDGPGAQ